MARSLSLAAYMAYARRTTRQASAPDRPRPKGELVWAHASDPARAAALCQIAERLALLRPGLHMLLTQTGESPLASCDIRAVIRQPLPQDAVAEAETFLEHWQPDICLWTGGDLRPALLTCADQRDIPLYLVDAEEGDVLRPSWRWFPDLPRSLLKRFAQVQVRNEAAARTLRRIGIPDADISVTGALRAEAMPLPYHEGEREEMALLLRGRPLWLAARLKPGELDVVLEARRKVSRMALRLLLIIVPDDPADAPAMLERLEREDLHLARWAEGEMPEETTQVVLAEEPGELGLWYRLAPICLMGCSLLPGLEGHDPNVPAVHGSAILYGPSVRRHLADYSRYAEAGAARIVRDAETLAAAVQGLIAPDKAATMAHAAWDVASQGAAVTDRVLDLVQDTLDVIRAGG